MTLKFTRVRVLVADYAKAFAFYGEKLGLAARFSEKGDRVRVASNDNMVMLTSTTFGAEGISIEELEAWMDAP